MTRKRLATLCLVVVAASLLFGGCSDDDPVAPEPQPPYTVSRTIFSSDYLNNRFFRLDLPDREENGRVGGEWIDLNSIQVYRFMGAGAPQPNEITNVAVYVDSTGFRDWDGIDFTDPYLAGKRWQRIQFTEDQIMRDPMTGHLMALDMGQNVGDSAILACTYRVVDGEGFEVGQVGDDPGRTDPTQGIPGLEGLHYRMKLLKARTNLPDPHVFDYILRNIYSLGSSHIDPSIFNFRIEFNDPGDAQAHKDENGIDYIHIFGLDRMNAQGEPGPDGVADFHDATLFDLARGLLKFPLDFPEPFAAGEEAYRANLDPDLESVWTWEGTRLAENQTPAIYDPDVLPTDYFQYQKFRLEVETTWSEPPPPPAPMPRNLSLERTDWFYASRPVGKTAESRIDQIRWFLPRERVLRRYLDPDLLFSERDRTQPALDLYLRADDGTWDLGDWGGITQGVSRTGWDLREAGNFEIWINDGTPDRAERRGRLHIDFGYIDEDGFWPMDEGLLVTGTYEREDSLPDDGIFTLEEDVGLDGDEFGPERFDAAYEIDGDRPYPRINGTARNGREDHEDLNGDTLMTRDNGYFTTVIDLKETEAQIDVVYDYDHVQDLVDARIAWRKYRIPIAEFTEAQDGTVPNIKAITHFRIWYEDPAGNGPAAVQLQISDPAFVE